MQFFGEAANHFAFNECYLRWLIRDCYVFLSYILRDGISEVVSIFMTLDILVAMLHL